MSLKPEVVRVNGVHSVTNSSQGGDIGFPQLQLEKLFEAATVKELESGAEYTEGKKYAYLNPNWPETDPNKYLSIENEAHFYCVRDGYCGLDGSVDHYYTKEGDDYKYNVVPPTGSWEGKRELSNAIKDKDLYSISREEERVYIEGQGYYKKENNGYKRQGDTVYDTFKKSGEVDWSESNKYRCKSQLAKDEEGNNIEDSNGNFVFIYTWQNNDNVLAKSGYYLAVFKLDGSNTFAIQLLNVIFNEEGAWDSSLEYLAASLYKLSDSDIGHLNYHDRLYIKDGIKLNALPFNTEIAFITDPTDPAADNSVYTWNEQWHYPNGLLPNEGTVLLADENFGGPTIGYSEWQTFDQADFPLFTEVALTKISKVSNASYPVYEKLAVTINYKYSGNNNLKFIFTDKSVDEVLDVCGLNNPDISKYVHLTNLEYSKNS